MELQQATILKHARETPSDAPGSPVTPDEGPAKGETREPQTGAQHQGERRPFWRRVFGG
jgi:hypothetical protein